MDPEELDAKVLEHGPALVEVTAYNPANGKSRALGPSELREVLLLLIDYERAPESPSVIERFADLGLDISWYSPKEKPARALFICKTRDGERAGYSLHGLLWLVRETVRASHGVPPGLGRARDKMIFVVDDDDSIRDLLAFALRREGFQTDVFENGAEVVQKIRNELPDRKPDMLVLDLMMPILGGYDVIRELESGEFPPIPIVVVTGRSIDRQAVEHLRHERNVVDFLPKPVNPKTLALSTHKLLNTAPARGG